MPTRSEYASYVGEAGYSEQDIEREESERILRVKEAWKFWFGDHWDFERDDDEPLVTVNLIRSFVKKTVAFCASKGFSVSVPKPLENLTLPYLEKTWKENMKNRFGVNAYLEGSVSGDAVILVTAAKNDDKKKDVYMSSNRIRLLLLNSTMVTLRKDPLDEDTVIYARIVRRWSDPDEEDEKKKVKEWIQIITPEKIKDKYGDRDWIENKNGLGEVPIVHIKNLHAPHYAYGLSDLDDLIPLNRELNEKLTDCSDIINYQGSPVTVITGARAKNITKHSKALWSGLPADSKVFNLELETDLPAANAYIEKIENFMYLCGSIPGATMGKELSISNTSAAALHIVYQPLLELANLKRTNYQPGFEKVNYFIIRHLLLLNIIPELPKDLCATCGGKIHYERDDVGKLKWKKCYHVNQRTFEFLTASEMKVPFIRRHWVGDELVEIPYDQAKKEYNKLNASYWDIPVVSDIPEVPEEEINPPIKTGPGIPDSKNPAPPDLVREKRTEYDRHIMSSALRYPPEPDLIQPRKKNGEKIDKSFHAVPTDCEAPVELNPFDTKVQFADTLPKDLIEMANLLQLYLYTKVWSRDRAMEQIGIEDPEKEKAKISEEEQFLGGIGDIRISEEMMEFMSGKSSGTTLMKKPQSVPPRYIDTVDQS